MAHTSPSRWRGAKSRRSRTWSESNELSTTPPPHTHTSAICACIACGEGQQMAVGDTPASAQSVSGARGRATASFACAPPFPPPPHDDPPSEKGSSWRAHPPAQRRPSTCHCGAAGAQMQGHQGDRRSDATACCGQEHSSSITYLLTETDD